MDVDDLIRRAARKVASEPPAAALFECLRPHLLDPDHDVGSMLRACDASRAVQDRLVAILEATCSGAPCYPAIMSGAWNFRQALASRARQRSGLLVTAQPVLA